MKELNNIVTRLESICRKTIEDVDKTDINDFGITYCELFIQKGNSGGYNIVERQKWDDEPFEVELSSIYGF